MESEIDLDSLFFRIFRIFRDDRYVQINGVRGSGLEPSRAGEVHFKPQTRHIH